MLPRGVRPRHRIQDRQQRAHAGHERHLLGCARRDEPKIERSNDHVAASRDERAHVQDGAHGRAAAPDAPLAPEGPAVTGERGHADQRRDLCAIEPPQLREMCEERATHDGTNAWHRAEPMLLRPPDGTLLDGVVEVVVGGADAALTPAEMADDLSADGGGRMLKPIALGRAHVEPLPPARHERIEALEDRIRQRAQRGMHPLRTGSEELRIQAVGFGELSSGFGDVANLVRVRGLRAVGVDSRTSRIKHCC